MHKYCKVFKLFFVGFISNHRKMFLVSAKVSVKNKNSAIFWESKGGDWRLQKKIFFLMLPDPIYLDYIGVLELHYNFVFDSDLLQTNLWNCISTNLFLHISCKKSISLLILFYEREVNTKKQKQTNLSSRNYLAKSGMKNAHSFYMRG